ncbi:MAG: GNAT family N-acetyltransferase [Spirochaetes bacterium]|jgi:aminoglycoside 6'-N-acetyltransferase I|nr:GNAT family N-acetyltransferase [Spirochaetota bacterium]
MKIVPIDSSDLIESCVPLYVDVFNAAPWHDQWTHETVRRRLIDFFNTPGFVGYCTYSGSEVVGGVLGNIESFFKGDYFYLKEMFVSCKCQRQGVGNTLLKSLNNNLKERDVHSIILITDRSLFPCKFYHKNGFTVIDDMTLMHIDI